MNRREVIELAWAEQPPGAPFELFASVPHGARLPGHLKALVCLHVGPGLPTPVFLSMTEEGITTELLFAGAPFECVIPWGAVAGVRTETWAVQWFIGEPPAPKRPSLRVVS